MLKQKEVDEPIAVSTRHQLAQVEHDDLLTFLDRELWWHINCCKPFKPSELQLLLWYLFDAHSAAEYPEFTESTQSRCDAIRDWYAPGWRDSQTTALQNARRIIVQAAPTLDPQSDAHELVRRSAEFERDVTDPGWRTREAHSRRATKGQCWRERTDWCENTHQLEETEFPHWQTWQEEMRAIKEIVPDAK